MKKLYELLNMNKPIEGDVGIEIECEGKNLHEVFEKGWRTENDGSLRGRYPETCAEYILDSPIKVNKVEEYVHNLAASLEGAKFDFSFRTSVHVHVNAQDLTEAQVCNMVYTYLLLEEPLINFCGRDRKGNRFCLRVVDAEGIVGYVRQMCEKGVRTAFNWDENQIRYSAINLASMRKYGSIEFRSMRGNMDADTIHIWANSLVALREYAKTKASPQEIREEFEKNGAAKFIKKVLAGYAVYYDYPRAVKEMQRSFSLTLEIPYSYKEARDVPEEEDNVAFYSRKFNLKLTHVRLYPRNKNIIQIIPAGNMEYQDWQIAEPADIVRLSPKLRPMHINVAEPVPFPGFFAQGGNGNPDDI